MVVEHIVGRKPKSLSFEEAAAMPFTTITAWEALYDRLRHSSSSILIIDGAGGVGFLLN